MSAPETLPPPAPRLTLRPAWHPDHERIERQLALDDRPYMARHFGDDIAVRRFLAQRIPAYGGLCYPHALADRIFSIGRMMNVTTLMDDAFTRLGQEGDRSKLDALRLDYLAALDDRELPFGSPIAQLMRDALRPMRRHLETKPAVWDRLKASIREQIHMQARSASISASKLSLDRYLALRRVEGYGDWITMLTEYAIDVDMEQPLRTDPSLAEVRTATIDSVILVNDLYSFRKESLGRETLNAAWILMREHDIDAATALVRLGELCERNERKLIGAMARVLDGELGPRPDVRAYVEELGHMSAGNAEFHAFSVRYRPDAAGEEDPFRTGRSSPRPAVDPPPGGSRSRRDRSADRQQSPHAEV